MSLHRCVNEYCGALYNADSDWVRGFNANGPHSTAPMAFTLTSTVPRGHCPVCLTDQAAPQPKQYTGCM